MNGVMYREKRKENDNKRKESIVKGDDDVLLFPLAQYSDVTVPSTTIP